MGARSLLVLMAVAAFAVTPAAGAKRIGSLAPKDDPIGDACGSCAGFQETTAPSSPSYRVPKGRWTITSWRTRNTTDEAVAARLWVFRHVGDHRYKLIARSRKETAGARKAPSHRASIEVKRGDLIGIEAFGHMVTFFTTDREDDLPGTPNCDHVAGGQVVGSGASCTLFEEPGGLVNVTAKLKRR